VVADPGAAFVPEVLERLAALKKEDRAAFELLRSKLKKSDCRVTALDKAIAKESGDAGGRGVLASRGYGIASVKFSRSPLIVKRMNFYWVGSS
jgi:hypothetical protein